MRIGGEKLDLPDNIDLYQILGLDKSLKPDAQTIKKAYNKLTLKFHPDRTGGDQTQFILINRAYTILSNEDLRKEYDNFFMDLKSSNIKAKHNTSTSDPFTSFKEIFNSPKIQEELRWINDIINSSYQLFQQIKKTQRQTHRSNKYTPVQPIENFDFSQADNDRRPITDEDFDALLNQLMSQKSRDDSKRKNSISSKKLPQSDTQQPNSANQDSVFPYEINVVASLRQYLLKRHKKIKVLLPNNDTKILTVKIKLGEQCLKVSETNDLLSIKVKIEPLDTTSGTWSLHPKQNNRERTCLIFRAYDALNNLIVNSPLTYKLLFKLTETENSSLKIYYGQHKTFDVIVYSDTLKVPLATLETPLKVPSESQTSEVTLETPLENLEIIHLYAFRSIEELLDY